ncbi:MAG: MFS transporter [Dialister invisus]|uniref:MFS transporter n=1 Tax=Dialister invisus TaxID=218538 RepID=UPI0039910D14
MVRRWQVHAGVLLAVSYVFCGMVQDKYQLFVARAFQGVENGYVAAAMTIISDSAEPKKLGVTLGVAQTALLVGGICGPLLGGIVAHEAGMRNSCYILVTLLRIVSAAVIFCDRTL